PLQAFLSSIGVAFSVAILMIGLAMFDGVVYMMDVQFKLIQREDLSVSFNEPKSTRALEELAQMGGVTRVEPYRYAPARLHLGHRTLETALQGVESEGYLRRIIDADRHEQPLPLTGL